MELVANKLIKKSCRANNKTIILIHFDDNEMKLLEIKFLDDGNTLHISDVLRSHKLKWHKFELYTKIPNEAVDYMIKIRKEDIAQMSRVLFQFNNTNFDVEDFWSLREKEEVTSSVVDYMTSQVYAKKTDDIIAGCFVMYEAMCLIKDKDNSVGYAYLDSLLRPIDVTHSYILYLPFCVSGHWKLFAVKILPVTQTKIE